LLISHCSGRAHNARRRETVCEAPDMSRFTTGRAALLALALSACATAPPPLPDVDTVAGITPYGVAREPETTGDVVWGGMILTVDNLEQHSEITVLAYPLDKKQRPMLEAPTEGRFVVQVPGFVEPFDYPQGRFVTLRATLSGTREALIDEQVFVLPVVQAQTVRVWPADFRTPPVRFSIGIGISR
jgi:outer membrane lipoprotein